MFWIWVLVLFTSCQRYCDWQYHRIDEKNCKTTRIHYHSKDPVQGIDIEILQAEDQLATYLQVHSQPLPSSSEHPGTTQIKLFTMRGQKIFFAPIHAGGQRVRLSEVMQRELISSLTEGNPITLELSGYRETIDPVRFQKTFQRLSTKAPSILNRIRLY